MKTKLLTVFSVFAAGLLLAGILVPAGLAQAATPEPPAQATQGPWQATLAPFRETLQALPTPDPVLLEDLLQREQLALNDQQVRIDMAHQIAGLVQTFIDNQKAAGKDTSALEAALANFNQAISQTETYHAQAAGILASPAGFDANGKVTDREQARQTVRGAGQSLRLGHLTITSATVQLRSALLSYRSANKAS